MRMKEEGISGWMYKWISGLESVTPSLCNWFWVVIWGTIVVPLNIIPLSFLIWSKNFREEPNKLTAFKLILFQMMFAYILVASIAYVSFCINDFLIAMKITTIVISLALIAIFLIGELLRFLKYLIDKLPAIEYCPPEESEPSKFTTSIKEGWKSYKGKYCPKIDWE